MVTCVYGPAVTYAFPDPLITAYRYSVIRVSLIIVLDACKPDMAWRDNRECSLVAGILCFLGTPRLLVLTLAQLR